MYLQEAVTVAEVSVKEADLAGRSNLLCHCSLQRVLRQAYLRAGAARGRTVVVVIKGEEADETCNDSAGNKCSAGVAHRMPLQCQ